MSKRSIDILVLSDIHLGTYGCHAKELLQYLKTVKPKVIVLNGDIIDIWQFSKRYWPAYHMMVVKYFIGQVAKGIPVYFIPGNHDELLRKFKGFQLGSLKIGNKLSLRLNGEKVWIFHGDVFDVVMQHAKWLAKLGAIGYDMLILINRMVNYVAAKLGRSKISLSKKVKNSVKSAVSFINKFETTACEIAASNQFKYVICGHIHEPADKVIVTEHGAVRYLNSGDWIENLTALEYNDNDWKIYRYQEDPVAQSVVLEAKVSEKAATKQMFQLLLADMSIKSSK